MFVTTFATFPVVALFNETRGSRFSKFEQGATFERSGFVFPTKTHPTIAVVAERAWSAMNANDRPNGRTERSLSMGDVVEVQTPDGNIYLTAEMVGFRRLNDAEVASMQVVGIGEAPDKQRPMTDAATTLTETQRERIVARLDLCIRNREQRIRGTGKTSVKRAILTAEIEAYRAALDVVNEEVATP